MTIRPSLALAAALTAAVSLAVAPEPAARRSVCPDGLPATGDIGIESLLCAGNDCSVNLRPIEPSIRGIRPDGPAAGRLQEGDLLIAVDGAPIASREGGRRLANLEPGVPVTLRIHRGEREMDVTVIPDSNCRIQTVGPAGGTTGPAVRRLPGKPPADRD